ncbi:unnamed protein product [Bemisia tabaci]|uniref:Uncharacterized protein n=1 Tax=Bemisia tabaci TaxID=7038 RepID=A0A9P0AJN7_BEMTA|nr:PREDICTED: uncharacterized protein LOC109038112 [Bemisia tabaci]CAH0393204.1 unnamed protein product [Bemisia tabaci]
MKVALFCISVVSIVLVVSDISAGADCIWSANIYVPGKKVQFIGNDGNFLGTESCRNLRGNFAGYREIGSPEHCLMLYERSNCDKNGPKLKMPAKTKWNWDLKRKDRPQSLGCC